MIRREISLQNIGSHSASFYEPCVIQKNSRSRILLQGTHDLFNVSLSPFFLLDSLRIICNSPHIDWIVITDNPVDMIRSVRRTIAYLHPLKDSVIFHWITQWIDTQHPPENLWVGVKACGMRELSERLPKLAQLPVACRMLMLTPLRERVDLRAFSDFATVQWVVLNGDIGLKAQPLHPDWVRQVRDDCTASQIAFFFDSWGEWVPRNERLANGELCLPSDASQLRWTCLEAGKYANTTCSGKPSTPTQRVYMQRVGSDIAGAWLDSQLWQQTPLVASAYREQLT